MTLEDLPPAIASAGWKEPSLGLSYSKNIGAYRSQLILRALSESQGNRAAAAKALGLQRTYLSRLIKTSAYQLNTFSHADVSLKIYLALPRGAGLVLSLKFSWQIGILIYPLALFFGLAQPLRVSCD